MDYELIYKAEAFVKSRFDEIGMDDVLTYHNWSHAAHVRDSARLLAAKIGLSAELRTDLELAALFHDIDYLNGREGHEQRSAEKASTFFTEQGLSAERVTRVEQLILATDMSRIVETVEEKIMKDADMSHLGSKDYRSFSNKLKNELNNFEHNKQTKKEWQNTCLTFLRNHEYLTQEARQLFGEVKQQNLNQLMSKTENRFMDGVKKKKADIPEKGIETMFRVALRNHLNLSRMADDKANTLISVNAIILSIVLSALFPKLDNNPFLLVPGLCLIAVSIVTIIIATLSTIPKTTHGKVAKADVENRKGNLIFFGNFHSMPIDEFEWAMSEMMQDKEYLYNTLKRDLFYLGSVLNKKYVLLRYAYVIFVLGLIVSIAQFVFKVMSVGPEALNL
jgi:predicted metal-dependent HD superfamily phosphohydrolase